MIIPHSNPLIDKDDIDSVVTVLQSGHIAEGTIVAEFEKRAADFLSVKGAVAANSGTAALHMGLLALGIGAGDTVLIPSYVCTALLNAVQYTGAIPVICDINASDYNISVSEIKKKADKNTKAVIVPHMFGNPSDIDKLLELDIPLIEDIAHSIGASYKGRMVGSFGAFSISSFYATKMFTSAEGGMLFSDSEDILMKAREMRSYDEKQSYQIRFNYKMSDLQAALGLSQLLKLPAFIARRKELAAEYNHFFSVCEMRLPAVTLDKEHVFYRYVIQSKKDIEAAIRQLDQLGIQCRRPVYIPLHRYVGLDDFPVADKVFSCALSIPLYPALSEDQVKKLVTVIKDYFSA